MFKQTITNPLEVVLGSIQDPGQLSYTAVKNPALIITWAQWQHNSSWSPRIFSTLQLMATTNPWRNHGWVKEKVKLGKTSLNHVANQIEVKYQPHQFCMTWLVTPPPRWGTVVGPGWKRLHSGQRNVHESPKMRTTKPPIRNRHSNQWYPMVSSGLIKPYISWGVC